MKQTLVLCLLCGLAVSSAPRALPSRKNCTPTTPTLSLAVAETTVEPETVAPLAGDVKETMGAVVSALLTDTVKALVVVEFPAASRALTVKEWEPLAMVVVFQETL